MELSEDDLADAWIEATRFKNPNRVPEELQDRAWKLASSVRDHPAFAWRVIKNIVSRYSEDALFTEGTTEAQHILANLGAGPLEDLLNNHGDQIIDDVETEARRDRRFFWTLACVWGHSMSHTDWCARVQRVTGGFSP